MDIYNRGSFQDAPGVAASVMHTGIRNNDNPSVPMVKRRPNGESFPSRLMSRTLEDDESNSSIFSGDVACEEPDDD